MNCSTFFPVVFAKPIFETKLPVFWSQFYDSWLKIVCILSLSYWREMVSSSILQGAFATIEEIADI